MAEMKGKKKRLSINLSFLTLSDSRKRANARFSPAGPNGVVGLGILAAMKADRHPHRDPLLGGGAALAISPKSASNSIHAIKRRGAAAEGGCRRISAEEVEGCEEYTCVISHVGENLFRKREYFEAEILGADDGCAGALTGSSGGGGGGGSAAESGGAGTSAFSEADFLSSCFLCEKKLHGLDVFMYR